MPGYAVDGLISGLDTTSLIKALLQAEAAPQNALKAKVSVAQAAVSAFQSINSKYAALQTAAETLSKAPTWSAVAATSSDPSVTATADATATAGSFSFRVTSTAVGQISISRAVPLSDPGTFTGYPIEIRDASGTPVTSVTPASGSLSDVVTAINSVSSTTGVRAMAVQVAPGSYRLQLASTRVGAASAFSVNPDFATSAGIGAPMQQATDAVIHVGPASGGYDITSASNTFTGAVRGVTFTVTKADVDVTLTMAKDPKALADKVAAMVDAANAALAEIGKQTSFDPATKKKGPLLGDSTVRALQADTVDRATAAVTLPDSSTSTPAVAGIQTDRSGRLTFDREKFLALLSSDPAKAQAVVSEVATRLTAVAKDATSSTTGSLTLAVQGRNNLIRDLNHRIDNWDDRLAMRKAMLQRQFAAMETALSSMKSQSSWLAGQIATLPTTSS